MNANGYRQSKLARLRDTANACRERDATGEESVKPFVIQHRHANGAGSRSTVLSEGVKVFEHWARVIAFPTFHADADGNIFEGAELTLAPQIHGHPPGPDLSAAVLASIELMTHGSHRECRDDPQSPRFRQAAHKLKGAVVMSLADNQVLGHALLVPLPSRDYTRVDGRFHILYGEVVLLQFLLGMACQLVLSECDLAPELSDA